MKYLKRINESRIKIDSNYIHQCFVELIDDEKVELELIDDEYTTVRVFLKSLPDNRLNKKLNTIRDSSLYSFFDDFNYNNDILQDLEIAIKRVEDKYTDCLIKFTYYITSIFIEKNNIQINENNKKIFKLFNQRIRFYRI